jgi:hypothetical protein
MTLLFYSSAPIGFPKSLSVGEDPESIEAQVSGSISCNQQ